MRRTAWSAASALKENDTDSTSETSEEERSAHDVNSDPSQRNLHRTSNIRGRPSNPILSMKSPSAAVNGPSNTPNKVGLSGEMEASAATTAMESTDGSGSGADALFHWSEQVNNPLGTFIEGGSSNMTGLEDKFGLAGYSDSGWGSWLWAPHEVISFSRSVSRLPSPVLR